MPQPFQAYEGDGPFIFVSYSHRDADAVMRVMETLHKSGFNVWFDEGISPGTIWREELAERIMACDTFLCFLSSQASKSKNCVQEVSFATEHNKHTLVVYLEDFEVPPGLSLTLSDRQGIEKFKIPDQRFNEVLLKALKARQMETMKRLRHIAPLTTRLRIKISLASNAGTKP